MSELLSVKDLVVKYKTDLETVSAVNGISFTLNNIVAVKEGATALTTGMKGVYNKVRADMDTVVATPIGEYIKADKACVVAGCFILSAGISETGYKVLIGTAVFKLFLKNQCKNSLCDFSIINYIQIAAKVQGLRGISV